MLTEVSGLNLILLAWCLPLSSWVSLGRNSTFLKSFTFHGLSSLESLGSGLQADCISLATLLKLPTSTPGSSVLTGFLWCHWSLSAARSRLTEGEGLPKDFSVSRSLKMYHLLGLFWTRQVFAVFFPLTYSKVQRENIQQPESYFGHQVSQPWLHLLPFPWGTF